MRSGCAATSMALVCLLLMHRSDSLDRHLSVLRKTGGLWNLHLASGHSLEHIRLKSLCSLGSSSGSGDRSYSGAKKLNSTNIYSMSIWKQRRLAWLAKFPTSTLHSCQRLVLLAPARSRSQRRLLRLQIVCMTWRYRPDCRSERPDVLYSLTQHRLQPRVRFFFPVCAS